MKTKPVAQKPLIIDSQDPRQFCLRMVSEIQHAIDPSFLEGLCMDRVRRFFFVNQGWRLTSSGFQAISDNYISYSSKNERNTIITGKIILNTDDCVGGPWFLKGQNIVVFDPTIHFELQMVNGNLNDFVDFKRTH